MRINSQMIAKSNLQACVSIIKIKKNVCIRLKKIQARNEWIVTSGLYSNFSCYTVILCP